MPTLKIMTMDVIKANGMIRRRKLGRWVGKRLVWARRGLGGQKLVDEVALDGVSKGRSERAETGLGGKMMMGFMADRMDSLSKDVFTRAEAEPRHRTNPDQPQAKLLNQE